MRILIRFRIIKIGFAEQPIILFIRRGWKCLENNRKSVDENPGSVRPGLHFSLHFRNRTIVRIRLKFNAEVLLCQDNAAEKTVFWKNETEIKHNSAKFRNLSAKSVQPAPSQIGGDQR